YYHVYDPVHSGIYTLSLHDSLPILRFGGFGIKAVHALQFFQQLFAPAGDALHLLVAQLVPARLYLALEGLPVVAGLVPVHVLAALLVGIDAVLHVPIAPITLVIRNLAAAPYSTHSELPLGERPFTHAEGNGR